MVEIPVDYGVLAAVRVIEALTVTPPSVRLEVDVARITPAGATHLEQTEADAVRNHVERWISAEQELLDALMD